MEPDVIYYSIGMVSSLLPIYLLLILGPKVTRHRVIFFFVGLATASAAGGVLYWVNFNQRFFSDPEWIVARAARTAFAGVVEEIFRYPGLLVAQYLAVAYLARNNTTIEEEIRTNELELESRFVDDDIASFSDPHGMGLYFGVGYGLAETVAFYLYPRYVYLTVGYYFFDLFLEVEAVVLRVTAVMLHTALTYLAMAITKNKSYLRITMFTHITINVLNKFYEVLSPNKLSSLVLAMFTRFAVVAIAYFFLRPRIRYQSPAVLFYILVLLMLAVILLSTLLFLLVNLITRIALGDLPI